VDIPFLDRLMEHARVLEVIEVAGLLAGVRLQDACHIDFGSPLRSEDQSFGSWGQTFKPSLKSDQCVIEILGMHILEDDLPFSMIHGTDNESQPLLNTDLDPSRGLEPAGNCGKCSVEFRSNLDYRNFSTRAARLHQFWGGG
jgi:hypothetical protein